MNKNLNNLLNLNYYIILDNNFVIKYKFNLIEVLFSYI